jgi:16S rRNA (guanine527-N7)-methyltransferase
VNASAIAQAIDDAGLETLTPKALAQFETYLALLLKWNARLNLTAVREPAAIIRRHFVECIQCAQMLPKLSAESTLLDFGSGAGFPGIPIAICRPDIKVTLAESQRKKAAFLQEVVRALDINAEVFDGRVEEMPSKKCFSAVTLRAVDKTVVACQSAITRIASGGWIVLFAMNEMEVELKASLPEITWRQKLPVFGLDRGVLLVGQRSE